MGGSTTHAYITEKGRALNVLFNRLLRAASSGPDGWEESPQLKSVRIANPWATYFGQHPSRDVSNC